MKVAWDFFLSFIFRAIFTAALVGGVCFLVWAFDNWRTGAWKDQPEQASLSFVLAGITTLVGMVGTIRRGNAEENFSLVKAVGTVTGAVVGANTDHVHIHVGHVRGRTLRRFPTIESFVLGGILIALWPAVALWREDAWPLRVAAIIGIVQVLWGFVISRVARASKGTPANEDQIPPNGFEVMPRRVGQAFDASVRGQDASNTNSLRAS